jgi:hypothetical protein
MFTSKVSRHSSPLMRADILERCLVRGIVDEDIDATELACRLADHLSAVLRISEIAFDKDSPTILLFDELSDLLSLFLLVEIGDQDVSTLAREGNGYRPPYPAVAAGYDGLLP